MRGLHAGARPPSHCDQSCGGTAYTTGALPWLNVGSLGRTGQGGEEVKLPFAWEGVNGMSADPAESSRVRIRGQADMGDIVVSVYYKTT